MESNDLCIVKQLMEKLDAEDLEVGITVACMLWLHRNSFVFGGEFTPPSQLVTSVNDAVVNFHLANQSLEPNDSSPVQHYQRWDKPLEGMVKLNWNATLDISN